ncbi:MAG: ANTAR domain-containing protein [Ruminococcus sp.]|nr:ANTAR domain-containing protein [Ruminococcus sp.]
MERVLIASSGEKATSVIVGLVKETYPNCQQAVVNTGSETRRSIAQNDYDAVLINSPLSDEYGHELAEHITQSTLSGCIMIVKAENSDEVSYSLEDYGVAVISKPINKKAFYDCLHLVNASRKRMLGLQKENIKLHKRLEELRTINRAKFALMQYLNFTETQAHRYLEKQAMDMRCTKLEVAKEVIKTYEP